MRYLYRYIYIVYNLHPSRKTNKAENDSHFTLTFIGNRLSSQDAALKFHCTE